MYTGLLLRQIERMRSVHGRTELNRPLRLHTFVACGVVTLVLLLTPILLVTFPPLHDYPSHLARIAILNTLDGSEVLQNYYEFGPPNPNLAMDFFSYLARSLLSPSAAGRIFIGIVLVLSVSGVVFLHYVLFRRLSIWPLVSALFLYNWILLYGFLNYLCGVGLMLFGVAIHLLLRSRSPAVRVLAGSLSAIVQYFAHFYSFGLYAICVLGIELQPLLTKRRGFVRSDYRDLVIGMAQFSLPTLLFFLPALSYGQVDRIISRNWLFKPLSVLQTFLFANPIMDILTVGFYTIVGATLILAGCVYMHRSMRLPLILLTVLFVLVPFGVKGEGVFASFLDFRMPIAMLFLAVAGIELRIDRRVYERLLLAGFVGLLLVRTWMISGEWRRHDETIQEIYEAFSHIGSGSVLFAASTAEGPDVPDFRYQAAWRPPLKHVVSLAVLEKPMFVAAVYVGSYRVLRVKPKYRPAHDLQAGNPIVAKTPDAMLSFVSSIRRVTPTDLPEGSGTYLMVLYPNTMARATLNDLEWVAGNDLFGLWKVPSIPLENSSE